MANSWLRLWHDMPTDPKWRTIAKASGQAIGNVMAVYIHLLVCASNANERGRTQSFNCEDVASALDLETEQVEQIVSAMQSRVLDGDLVKGWDTRQVAREDGGAERSKAWREAKKQAKQQESNAAERNRTQDERKQTPDKDTDTDTDKDKKKTERTTARGSRLPENFEPDFQFAVDEGIQNTLEEAAKFRDYWRSQPGQKGVKLDWPATWRNWCRNAKPAPRAAKQVESFAERDERQARERYEEATGKRSRTVIDITPHPQVLERLQ